MLVICQHIFNKLYFIYIIRQNAQRFRRKMVKKGNLKKGDADFPQNDNIYLVFKDKYINKDSIN